MRERVVVTLGTFRGGKRFSIISVLTVSSLILSTIGVQPVRSQQGNSPKVKISVSDGVYTMGQADRGSMIFENGCSGCHVPEQFSDPFFLEAWAGPITDLFGFIRATMPEDSPGRFNVKEYTDILAYFFGLNGLPSGETELEADEESLGQIYIEPGDDAPPVDQIPDEAQSD